MDTGIPMAPNCRQHLLNDVPSKDLWQTMDRIGFVVMPGPFSKESLGRMAASYDQVMASASGAHYKYASTTTRVSDLLSYDASFEDVFLYPPLLEAAIHIIGEPIKLSSLLARTLRGKTAAQELHADLPRDSADAPLVGFILMIDRFEEANGATCFVPGSHHWHDLPADRLSETRNAFPGEILGCGEAGAMILFNGAIWHGHTANRTPCPRRSIQGYFVRRTARSGFNFATSLPSTTRSVLSEEARELLSLDD